MSLAAVLAVAAFTVYMAVAYRIRGMGSTFGISTPRAVDLAIVASPIALTTVALPGLWIAPVVAAVTCATVALGHAPLQDLGRSPEETERSHWLDRVFGRAGWAAEAKSLGVLGLLITLPAGFAHFLCGHQPVGLLYALSGAAKPLCYELGHRSGLRLGSVVGGADTLGRNPDAGEIIFGAWLGAATGLLFVATL